MLDRPELAGISGFRAMWDRPVVLSSAAEPERRNLQNTGEGPVIDWRAAAEAGRPGVAGFDAVHRSLLIRFPAAADAIAAELGKGRTLESVRLVLPYRGVEVVPKPYAEPAGMSFLGDRWKTQLPRWHAVAHALRRPWAADPTLGPTYNASIAGAGFWGRFGATDPESDRFPEAVAQAEVSQAHPRGELDLTTMLVDEAYGDSPAARLRAFADRGLIVSKLEVYDASYWNGGYEWAVATGGRAILVDEPRLEVTFAGGGTAGKLDLPPAADVRALAGELAGGRGGEPTAVMPTDAEIQAFGDAFSSSRPEGMPDWQWKRIRELLMRGGVERFPRDREAFEAWVDWQLALARAPGPASRPHASSSSTSATRTRCPSRCVPRGSVTGGPG